MELVLVTGVAGFIGFHVAKRLLSEGKPVVGVDNLSPYYDVALKKSRLAQLGGFKNFKFFKIELSDRQASAELFLAHRFRGVIHLAAQTGVRYSLQNPHAYADSNLLGFLNVLEGCRSGDIRHLIFASSSSVYGNSTKSPFSVTDFTDHPVSLYAATKKANELMAHSYSCLYGLPVTGLRFFSVYGPWGRPDMVLSLFTKAILEDRPIDIYNHGDMQRDFTYIEDVVEAVCRVLKKPAQDSSPPYRLFNVGNHHPVSLTRMVGILEDSLGRKAKKNFLPMQPGDILNSSADIQELEAEIGFWPRVSLEKGIRQFLKWHCSYYETPVGTRVCQT